MKRKKKTCEHCGGPLPTPLPSLFNDPLCQECFDHYADIGEAIREILFKESEETKQ